METDLFFVVIILKLLFYKNLMALFGLSFNSSSSIFSKYQEKKYLSAQNN